MFRGVCAWALFFGSLSTSGVARAAGAARDGTVVIVYEPHTEAVSRRLRQEIEAMGFDVQLEPEPERAQTASLDELAVTSRAIAAIHVKPLAAGGVEMTVLDRATGKTVHRELARVSASDPAGEELVATRTVELFRASLMELDADHPPRGDIVAPARVAATVHHATEQQLRRRTGVLTLAAGPAVLIMPAWRPSSQFWLAASWVSAAGIGVSASVLSPFAPAKLSQAAAEGSADLYATTYRVGAIWDSLADNTPVSGRLSAGLALTTLSVRGNASSPYVGLQADLVAWSPWVSAAGRVRITNHVAILAEVSGLLSVPRETVRFAGRTVADFARPACVAAIGPELSWP